MKSKILSKKTLLISVFMGLILFILLVFYFITQGSNQNGFELITASTNTIYKKEKESILLPALPLRLKIPKINIDTFVEYVGLTSDGAMDVPKGPVNVAWFNLGPRPGENGSSVIAGHYGWKNNTPAVFDNLHKLRKGDKIYIKDKKGKLISFIVHEIKIYDKDADASYIFNSNDGKAHLNLITCTGTWDKAKKTRSKRLIVFTDKE